MKKEYFVYSHSFAAPFFSDSDQSFVCGENPIDALRKYVADYRHPAGLYFAALYASSDDYHKGENPLARWTCNHELERAKRMKEGGGHSYMGHEPGRFEIDGKLVVVENPKQGRIEA